VLLPLRDQVKDHRAAGILVAFARPRPPIAS
jgi:hypothetical protein